MNKKKIGIIIAVVVVMMGYLYFKKYDNNPYTKFTNIKQAVSWIGHDEDYLYIYRSNDDGCKKLEDQIIEFASSGNVAFLSGNEQDEAVSLFNWDGFHEEYDLEIGVANENQEITYNEGESAQKYLDSTAVNDYGEIIKYEIVIADKDYLKINPKAKLNHVYAKLLTPNIDYMNSGFNQRITVLDIPALYYRGDDESIKKCYFGVAEIQAFLKEHQ